MTATILQHFFQLGSLKQFLYHNSQSKFVVLLQVLERAGVRGTVMDAVQASAERAAELGAMK